MVPGGPLPANCSVVPGRSRSMRRRLPAGRLRHRNSSPILLTLLCAGPLPPATPTRTHLAARPSTQEPCRLRAGLFSPPPGPTISVQWSLLAFELRNAAILKYRLCIGVLEVWQALGEHLLSCRELWMLTYFGSSLSQTGLHPNASLGVTQSVRFLGIFAGVAPRGYMTHVAPAPGLEVAIFTHKAVYTPGAYLDFESRVREVLAVGDPVSEEKSSRQALS